MHGSADFLDVGNDNIHPDPTPRNVGNRIGGGKSGSKNQLVDLLVALNLAISLGVLLISMYIASPMDFFVFPTALLLVTLLRLGINISASRLILLNGDAGKVISTFGDMVVGGNYVVGVVVFLMLMIIQFVVITNGAGRVAEVAARFTLDAMPGKRSEEHTSELQSH